MDEFVDLGTEFEDLLDLLPILKTELKKLFGGKRSSGVLCKKRNCRGYTWRIENIWRKMGWVPVRWWPQINAW